MDSTIKVHYDDWKAHLVIDVPTVSGGKAIKFNQPGYLAVSEGMGYGMLITVLMAGYDPQAQAIFDGLLQTVRARPAYSIPDLAVRPYLMDWRLAADGSSTAAAGGGWNAMDGDETWTGSRLHSEHAQESEDRGGVRVTLIAGNGESPTEAPSPGCWPPTPMTMAINQPVIGHYSPARSSRRSRASRGS